MVYPKISETFFKRFTSFLLLVNIVSTLTWTKGEATLTSDPSSSKINENSRPLTGNIDKLSSLPLSSSSLSSSSSSPSSSEHQLPKRSVSIPEEAYNGWNLVNPSSSVSSSLTSDNLPLSSASLSAPSSSSSSPYYSSSLTDEYETDLDPSDSIIPLISSDSELIKRDGGSRYAFGLGKRGSSADTRYSFGIGKRLPEMPRDMRGSKRLQHRFQFGLGKKSRYPNDFGKRDLYEYIKRRYSFGIGKRASQRYAFGLGK